MRRQTDQMKDADGWRLFPRFTFPEVSVSLLTADDDPALELSGIRWFGSTRLRPEGQTTTNVVKAQFEDQRRWLVTRAVIRRDHLRFGLQDK